MCWFQSLGCHNNSVHLDLDLDLDVDHHGNGIDIHNNGVYSWVI